MKIIQLNVWQGKVGPPIARFLKQEDPDLVCMQEVNDIKGTTCGAFSTLGEIKEQAGFAYADMAATYTYKYMNRTCVYGNAILSKHPLIQDRVVFATGTYKDDFDAVDDYYNVRNLQVCTVNLPGGKKLRLANHHGYHLFDPTGDETSIKAMQRVADTLAELQNSLIFCGDLNVTPDSKALGPLNSLPLRNLTTEYGVKHTLSPVHYVAADENVACDYIFVSEDVDVRRFAVSEALVSDHKPLIMEFELPSTV